MEVDAGDLRIDKTQKEEKKKKEKGKKKEKAEAPAGSCAVSRPKSVYVFSSITHQESHQEFCHAAGGKKNQPPTENGDKVKSGGEKKGGEMTVLFTPRCRGMQISPDLFATSREKREPVWDCLISLCVVLFIFFVLSFLASTLFRDGYSRTPLKSGNGFSK